MKDSLIFDLKDIEKYLINYFSDNFDNEIKINYINEFHKFNSELKLILHFEFMNEHNVVKYDLTYNIEPFFNKDTIINDLTIQILDFCYYTIIDSITHEIEETDFYLNSNYNTKYFNFNDINYKITFNIDEIKSKNLMNIFFNRYFYNDLSEDKMNYFIKEYKHKNLLSKIEEKPFVFKTIKI